MRCNSSASTSICRWFSSRELVTDSHSPIAIEQAPATSPASPVSRIVRPDTSAPATPITRLRFETSPSLAPSTAARSALPPVRWRPSSRARLLPEAPEGSRRGHRLDDSVVRALGARQAAGHRLRLWS